MRSAIDRITLLFAATCAVAFGDTLFIVPDAQASAPSNLPIGYGSAAIRYQEIVGSGQFAGPILITGIRLRAAAGTGALSFAHTSFMVTLSTTQAYPNTNNGHVLPSTTFANNVGPDAKVVYNAPLAGYSPGCASPGPCTFDVLIPFSSPFAFDANRGRLLMDVVASATISAPTGSLDGVGFSSSTTSTAAVVVGDPASATGTLALQGAVLGLVVAPSKIGVIRGGTWYLDVNGNGSFDNGVDSYFNWNGGPDSVFVHGDWNGSGTAKAGFFNAGLWYLDYDGNGMWDGGVVDKVYGFGWSAPGVTPIVGDWNGDGKTKVGIFYNGFWFLDYNGNGVWDGPVVDRLYGWGWQGCTPLTGDWNGDGRTKIGFFINGLWYLDYDGNGIWDGGVADKQYSWGWGAVTPVTGDWNGDGRTKIGYYYNGFWYLDDNGNGVWEPGVDKLYSWGWTGTTPLVGDWNGNGQDKIGIFINGFWYLDYNGSGVWDGNGTDRLYGFGQAGDLPITGRW